MKQEVIPAFARQGDVVFLETEAPLSKSDIEDMEEKEVKDKKWEI